MNKFETAYKSLKRNKACGIDDIISNHVLDFFTELKILLFYIIFSSGIFPDEMKMAEF